MTTNLNIISKYDAYEKAKMSAVSSKTKIKAGEKPYSYYQQQLSKMFSQPAYKEDPKAIKEIAEWIQHPNFQYNTSPRRRTDFMNTLSKMFSSKMTKAGLDPSKFDDVSKFLSGYSKEILPEMTFLYSQSHISYQNNEYSLSPRQLFERKKGDCDDQSLFAYKILKDKGIEAKVIKLYMMPKYQLPGSVVHVFCAFKTDKGWRYIDNRNITSKSAKDLAGLVKQMGKCEKARVVDAEKWMKGGEEIKEPEDYDDKNFFYINTKARP